MSQLTLIFIKHCDNRIMNLRSRHILALTLAVLPFTAAMANDAATADSSLVQRINDAGRIEIVQPDGLTQRLVAPAAPEKDEPSQPSNTASTRSVSRTGYRIQIFDSNGRGARDQAQSRKRAVESRMRQRAYVRFDSPYWRVRVGDYRSRSEAEAGLSELRRLFPGFSGSFRIVRDKINPME